MRKERYWLCEKCNKVFHRKKGEKPFYHCGQLVLAKRKFPEKEYRQREKMINKIKLFREKYYTKPRNAIGEVLKINKETRRAFKLFLKAKTKSNFVRKGELFLQSLHYDIWKDYNNQEKQNKYCKVIDDNGNIVKHRGRVVSIPKIIINTNLFDYGEYKYSLLGKVHSIEIKDGNLDEMKSTFIHETLHWIDDISRMHAEQHDKYWDMRLEWLKKKLNYNSTIQNEL